jgi:hypothetical protein
VAAGAGILPRRGPWAVLLHAPRQAVRRFQHLRVAEWPPEGGFSSVCDGVPLDQFTDLQEKSIRLLQSSAGKAWRWSNTATTRPRAARC